MNKAAVYARYSTKNQNDTSIADQIFSCRRKMKEMSIEIPDKDIFCDAEVSGKRDDRLQFRALREKALAGFYDKIFVYDLSRLSRSLYFTVIVLSEFKARGIRVLTVKENLDSIKDKLLINIMAVMNEQYVDDVRANTRRGQEGLVRAKTVFTLAYGYKICKSKTISRPNGTPYSDVEIVESEAQIVRRIFQMYADGNSTAKISKILNQEGVPTKMLGRGGWNQSSIYRKLNNPRYVGEVTWGKLRNTCHPLTGKITQIEAPKNEWLTIHREDLRIISQDLWEKAQERLKLGEGLGSRFRRISSPRKVQLPVAYPTHLLSGMLRCGTCGEAVTLTSGKNGGYYGCSCAARKNCENHLLIKRTKLENLVIEKLKEKIFIPENINFVYEKVANEIERSLKKSPNDIKRNEKGLQEIETKLFNLTNAVMAGLHSITITEQIHDLERRKIILDEEIANLKKSSEVQFHIPTIDWIKGKLSDLKQILEKKTVESSTVLRDLLGQITLTPIQSDSGKPFYVAKGSFFSMYLIERMGSPGSRLMQWWRRRESNP